MAGCFAFLIHVVLFPVTILLNTLFYCCLSVAAILLGGLRYIAISLHEYN
jgi:hypothetical protein